MNVTYREFLDLKTSQLILLHAVTEEPCTPKEVVDYFALNFPKFYSNDDESKEELLSKEQILPMLRYLGKKEFIKRDRSNRWMITPKGRGALIQNAFLTFRNVMQTITNSYIIGYLPSKSHIGGDDHCCLSIEPLNFPAFPSPVTKSRIQHLKKGKLFVIDLAGTRYDNSSSKLENLKSMQDHLSSLTAEVNIIIGEFNTHFLCLDPIKGLVNNIDGNSIDSCLVQFLFSVVSDPLAVLNEIFRVLKPGKFVIIVDYTSDKSLFQIYQKTLFQNLEEIRLPLIYQKILKPVKDRSKDAILSVIKKTSFEVIEVIDMPNLPRFVLKKPE